GVCQYGRCSSCRANGPLWPPAWRPRRGGSMTQHRLFQAPGLLLAGLVAVMGLLASTLGTSAVTARPPTASPRYGGTIEVAFTSDVTSFDPAQAYTIDWFIMNCTLFNGLYQYDRRRVPALDLAA